MSLDRRRFLGVLGAAPAVAAYSCADRERAEEIAADETHRDLRGVTLGQGALSILRHRLRRRGRRAGRQCRGRARRSPQCRSTRGCCASRAITCRACSTARTDCSIRSGAIAMAAWSASPGTTPSDLIAEHYQKALDEHGPEAVAMYGSGQWTVLRRLCRAQMGQGRHALQQPRSQRAPVHGQRGDGLHDAVPERRADGLLRRLRSRRRLRPVGQQHGGDAPGALQPHPGDQAKAPDGSHRRHRDAPHADLGVRRPVRRVSAGHPIWRWPTASCTCWSNEGNVDRAFIEENVVFKRGIEDLDQIGYGCFGEQAERYTFKDEARDSSCDELVSLPGGLHAASRSRELSGVPVEQIQALAEIYGDSDDGHRQPVVHGRQSAQSAAPG